MPTAIEGINYYTIQEAAKALQVTPQTVRAYIKQGKIKDYKIVKPLLIAEDSLKIF